MDDDSILRRISAMVDEEHRLRAATEAARDSATEDTRSRIRELEEALDQCWDLLRRRRAARRTSGDPESQGVRPASEVQRYLQ